MFICSGVDVFLELMNISTREPRLPLKAPVSEIFFSYQGEGIYAGEPQIFVRFAGCNLKCRYCDTPGALAADPENIIGNRNRLGVGGISQGASRNQEADRRRQTNQTFRH